MNKQEKVQSQILDKCISLIQSGDVSVTDCLQAYPQYREILEPLLAIASQVSSGLSPKGPPHTIITPMKLRILNQLRAMQVKSKKTGKRRIKGRLHLSRPAYAFLSLAILIIMLFSSIGISNASAQALPGDVLYPVKRGVEELRLLASMSTSADAELLSEFTGERLSEIEQLIALDPSIDLELALGEYEDMLSRFLEILEDDELLDDTATLEKLHGSITYHEVVLQRVLDKAPTSAQKGLENALERSSHGKEVIQTIQEGEHPSDLAPGKDKNGSENHGNSENESQGPTPKDKTKKPKLEDENQSPSDE